MRYHQIVGIYFWRHFDMKDLVVKTDGICA